MASDFETVMTGLAQMAAFRGADVAPQTLELFTMRLIAEGQETEIIINACRTLEMRERADGETAFPSLGTLLAECRLAGIERRKKQDRALAAQADAYALPPGNNPSLTREEAKNFMERLRRDVELARKAMQR